MRWKSLAVLCVAGVTATELESASSAHARHGRRNEEQPQTFTAAPRLAIIALAQQRISIYGAPGKLVEAPVSTGATGHETPAGTYTILQKEEEHHSNLYDDASMPYMERLTWTGMAMHAGALPGYPASHGCTRLSHGFAERLYKVTERGMRVVIVREDITPQDIEQPAIFGERPFSGPEGELVSVPADGGVRARLKALAAIKLTEAQAAEKHQQEAIKAAAKLTAEAAAAKRIMDTAEAKLAQAETELRALERAPEEVSRRSERDGAVKAQVAVKEEAARAQFDMAKAQAAAKVEAAVKAEEEAKDASAAASQAGEAAEKARQNTAPLSIFISRKTRRIYARRGNDPVFEGPVTIRDPDRPIGSFVFTAFEDTAAAGRVKWNVVSMYKNATQIEPYAEVKHELKKRRQANPADVTGAQKALQRLEIPQETLDHMSGVVLPGSSLIISDEGASAETGKDTDFVVFMSGDPQGGAAFRSIPLIGQMAERRGERSYGRRERTASSHSRSRHHGGSGWRGGPASPFAAFFGF